MFSLFHDRENEKSKKIKNRKKWYKTYYKNAIKTVKKWSAANFFFWLSEKKIEKYKKGNNLKIFFRKFSLQKQLKMKLSIRLPEGGQWSLAPLGRIFSEEYLDSIFFAQIWSVHTRGLENWVSEAV